MCWEEHKVTPQIKTVLTMDCPHCSEIVELSLQTHQNLENSKDWTSYNYSCPKCQGKYDQKVEDGKVYIKKQTGFRKESVVFLRHKGPDGHIYLVVKGRYNSDGEALDPEKTYDRYFYEQHTCPVNYFRDAESVLYAMPNGRWDPDPHGLFEYIGTFVPEIQPFDMDEITDNLKDLVERMRQYNPDIPRLEGT